MKISFENFGVIKQGEIEQKPLTILCGENNTGKTYAMYAMYCSLRPLNTEVSLLKDKIQPFFEKVIIEEKITIDTEVFIKENINKINTNNTISLLTSIPKIFNSGKVNYSSNSLSINFSIEELLKDIFHKEINENFFAVIFKKDKNSFSLHIEKNFFDISDFLNLFIYRFITTILIPSRFCFLLPAERAGLHLFFSELNAYRTNLLHSNTTKDNLLISAYPKPIADYIDWLNILLKYRDKISKLFSSDSSTLENKILGGNYSLDETNSINFNLNNDKGNLPLHLTSSTVKTYFGLWFYLQHMAQEGDVLMIDEPELSLHPKNQRNIARLFAQLVNKGIKIVISTHSDYIVREINNLIMLAHAPNQEIKQQLMSKYGYTEDELLTKDQVGAYLFKDNTIENMEISDEGIIATTFDEVIRDLNLSSDDIYYSLKDSHE